MGIDSAGTPARFAVQVKMSLRYMSYGSDFAPMGKAGVGVVGVRSACTPEAKTRLKSSAMSVPFGTGADDLPVGVQIVAPALGEPVMLQVAAELERRAPAARRASEAGRASGGAE